jgi:probable phosphoglycerate mutase
MSIVLVRHGETLLNVARTLQPADTPLSPRGLAQAQAVARRLANEGVGRLLSSDLPRALQTAEAIAAATDLPIVASPLLQERNYGDLRGQSYDSLGFNPLTMSEAPPGGESADDFRRRVAQAFAWIVQERAACGGTVVAVTHGLVIRALFEGHLQLPTELAMPQRLGNTSVTVVDPTAPHGVSLADCTRHLDELLHDDGSSLSGG